MDQIEQHHVNEGRSWARRAWRETIGRKRGSWPGTVAAAIALLPAEAAKWGTLVNEAARLEWDRLRREALI